MKTTRFPWLAEAIAIVLGISAAQSQQPPPSKPLGDVAREQRQARQQQGKASAGRVYTDIGAASMQSESPEKPVAAKDKPVVRTSKVSPVPPESQRTPPRTSVFDQAKRNRPEFIVVPAGTEIRVDIVEGKVVAPVRVGFATPIPALSIAAVKVNPVYYTPVFYHVVPGSASNIPVAYGETAELTAVTVRAVTYPVQANAIPLNNGSAMGSGIGRSMMSTRDAVFVLSAPLPIER
jgi:hypothetical protein